MCWFAAELPISLLSGRMRDHWHGMSRTGTVPRLFNLEDEPLLAMHPVRHASSRSLDSPAIWPASAMPVVR
jgi:assimilatory nitrate reductase catalytic subunit